MHWSSVDAGINSSWYRKSIVHGLSALHHHPKPTRRNDPQKAITILGPLSHSRCCWHSTYFRPTTKYERTHGFFCATSWKVHILARSLARGYLHRRRRRRRRHISNLNHSCERRRGPFRKWDSSITKVGGKYREYYVSSFPMRTGAVRRRRAAKGASFDFVRRQRG